MRDDTVAASSPVDYRLKQRFTAAPPIGAGKRNLRVQAKLVFNSSREAFDCRNLC